MLQHLFCLQPVNSIGSFQWACGILAVFLLLFFFLNRLCPFSARWQCSCLYKILIKLIGLPGNSWGSTPSDKRGLHRSFLDSHIFTPGFYGDGWLDPWVTCLISLADHCSATSLALFSEHAIQIGWGFPNFPVLFLFRLTIPSLSLSSCILL